MPATNPVSIPATASSIRTRSALIGCFRQHVPGRERPKLCVNADLAGLGACHIWCGLKVCMSVGANVVLWLVQIFLALFFVGAAFPKLTGRGLELWTGFSNLPRGLVLGIGIVEVLGAVGLVLPMASGVLPWLTPLAASGLAINVLMATGFHVREDERLKAIETTLWAAIAGIIAIGRWNLVDYAAVAISPRRLAMALPVLVAAAIAIAVVIYRRSASTTEPR